MGQIRKIGDTYYIEFYARGLLYSKVAGLDLAIAQELLADTEAKIAGGEALTIVRAIDLAVFFDQFLGYAVGEFGLKSSQRFERMLGHFKVFLEFHYSQIQQVSNITPSVIESYKAYLAASTKPRLTNFTLLLLREVLDYGIKLGFINDNPTVHIRLLPVPTKARTHTNRYKVAAELFAKDVGIGKVSKLLKLSDIGKVMYYANVIPLCRNDME